jgi:succinate dehydrogenase / fumarate reductase cytochrome b subunit
VELIKRFLTSPIGRKVMMALTGLFLILFLFVHVAGNLQLLSSASAFNEYAGALESTKLILFLEAGLVIGFLYHAINGVLIQLRNRKARPEKYAFQRNAGHTSRRSLASQTMIWTGGLLLAFVVYHVATMKFGHFFGDTSPHLFARVESAFQNPGIVGLYVVSMGIVGFHLWHGFGTVFETLGVRHRTGLRRTGQALGALITFGFLIIPITMFLV